MKNPPGRMADRADRPRRASLPRQAVKSAMTTRIKIIAVYKNAA
jgi:hypothetical protein